MSKLLRALNVSVCLLFGVGLVACGGGGVTDDSVISDVSGGEAADVSDGDVTGDEVGDLVGGETSDGTGGCLLYTSPSPRDRG